MKFIRLATIAALSTTILAGAATSVSAEEVRGVITDGQIEFIADEDSELEVIPPEDDPDVEIDPEVIGTTGPLSIVKAATMNFGTQVISNQNQTYNMVSEMARLANPEEDGPTEVPYVSFAQVQDVRGTNAGWDLQVQLSNFTAETQNDTLTGARVTFVQPRIEYTGTEADNAPTAHADGLTIEAGGESRSVMTATEGQGALASSVVWGNQTNLNTQFADDEIEVVENDAIRLFIPGSTAKDATTYEATLTWNLTSTPDNTL